MIPVCYVCQRELPAEGPVPFQPTATLAGVVLCESCGPCCADLGVAIGKGLAAAATLINHVITSKRGGVA